MYTVRVKIDVTPGGEPQVVHVSQYDVGSRKLEFEFYSTGADFAIPANATAMIRGTKPDGNGFSYDMTMSEGIASIEVTEQMTAVAGRVPCKIALKSGDKKLLSEKLILLVDDAALDKNTVQSNSEMKEFVEVMDHMDDYLQAAREAKEAQQAAEAAQAEAETAKEAAESAKTGAEEAASEANEAKEAAIELKQQIEEGKAALTEQTDTALEAVNEAKEIALGVVDDKAQDVVAMKSNAEAVAAQAFTAANNLSNEFAEVKAQADELSRAVQTVQLLMGQKVDGGYADAQGYLHLTSNGEDVADAIGPFAGGTGGGGGGGSETNAQMSANNTTGWISKTIAEGDEVETSLYWTSIEEDMPTGNGILTVTVGSTVRATLEVPQGDVSVDISSYLSVGSNLVTLRITDIYGQRRAFNLSVMVVAISVTSTFDTSEVFEGPILFPYTPTGKVQKTVHFLLDSKEIGTAITSVSGNQMTFTIPQQAHGAHSLQCYFDCELNGQTVRSNTLYFEITCVEPLNNTPIITSSYAADTINQYSLVIVPYRVYSPSSATADVKLYINDALVSTQTVDRTEQSYSFRAEKAGTLSFKIESGTATKTISVAVRESEVHVEPVTDSLALHLTAQGRSNNEDTRAKWTYENVSATLSGFGWRQDGWLTDDDGVDVLRLEGDARVVVPYKPFEKDFKTTGKTLEIEFATRQVSDYTATILSCFADNIGLKITPQNAVFRGAQTEMSTLYKDNEHIRLTITVEKQNEYRLMLVYINGIMSRAVQYASGERFSQLTPVGISIGSNDCGIDIYNIRVYDNNLSRGQVLDNWIADTQIGTLMQDRYTRNRVYDEYGKITPANLPSDLPYFILEATELPQYKGDKKVISGSYTDPVYPARSFTFTGCQINVQGTSSAIYYRKNYDMQFKGGFDTAAGNVATYGIKPTSVPFNRFVLKADVASSESANNTGLTSFYNDSCPYKTREMEADPRVRHGIEGIPIVVFHYNPDTQETTFLGKYNFNLPKRAAEPYGYSGDMQSWEFERNNSQNVKFQDDDFTTMAWDEVNQEYYPAWYDDFEARFPSDEWRDYAQIKELLTWVKSTDRSKATGEDLEEYETFRLNSTITTNAYTSDDSYIVEDEMKGGVATGYKIFTFTKDTPAYRLTKFRAELEDRFEVESATFYYLYTEILLMIDSRAKNMFIGFKGSDVTLEGSALTRKAVFEPYDMDTAIGTNNSGVLMFGYYLEDTDTVSSVISGGDSGGSDAPVFNAQDSVFWTNFRDSFRAEITAMYRNLRADRVWSYQVVESMFENHQSKWPEAIFNEDAYEKYIVPLTDPVTVDDATGQLIRTDRYLTMLQGSKEEQRKWWLYNRFRYMDSKYIVGDAANNIISLRVFAKGTLSLTPAIDMYVGVSFGGGTTPLLQRTTTNHAVNFEYVPQTGVTEMETWIYSADLITDVGDLSKLYPNELDFSKATKLKKLKVGDAAASYSNANLKALDVRNSSLLESIDCRNCPNLAITVDLEGSPRLEEAYFEGTSITGVELTDGGALETLHLPGTITTLTLLNLSKLKDLKIASYANISRLMLANMSEDVVDIIDTLQAIQANSQVYIEGLAMEAQDADEIEEFFDLLDTMKGVTRERSANGEWLYHDYETAQVSGTIHTASLTGAEIAAFNARYPYIKVTADSVKSYLTYMNYDGSSTIKKVTCLNGVPQEAAPPIPSRSQTAQYTYTAVGWNTTADQQTAQYPAAGPTADMVADTTLYAAYTWTTRTYTITWKNSNGTTLETDTNVPYGSMPQYNGSTPQNPTSGGGSFTGWTPTVDKVTGNQTYTASYIPTYTVVWYNDDRSTELYRTTVQQGSSATYGGTNPPVSAQGDDYTFTGWDKTTTNVQSNLSVYAQYKAPSEAPTATTADGAYGVEWDYSNSATTLTRKGLAAAFTDPAPATSVSGSGSSPFDNIAPWKDMKRYNVVGDTLVPDTDASFNAEGNDTVVYIPEFYYTAYKDTANNKWLWAISPTAKEGYKKHPGSGKYIGRYHTSGNSSAVYTKSGVNPLVNTSQTNFRTYSSAKGDDWRMLDLAAWSALQMLYLVEFANFDSQTVLGKGWNTGSVGSMGGTDSATYHTIKATGTHNQYRWVEDPFSNVLDWIDGFLGSTYAVYADAKKSYTGTTSNLETLGFKLPSSGWIKGFGYSEAAPWAFIPDTSGGSQSTYVPDYVRSDSSARPAFVGGLYADNTYYGFFFFGASSGASGTGGNLGSRLLYEPEREGSGETSPA